MDLTKLSDADLMALQSGDLTKVSDAGLAVLSGTKTQPEPEKRQEWKPNPVLEAGANILGGATGLMRGTANIVGSVFGNSKLGQQIWPTESLDKSSLSYMAGEFLDPVSAGIGGAAFKAAGAVPKIAAMTNPVMKPIAQGVVGGTVAGGATGALSEGGDAGTGAILGGVVGGVVPGGVITARKLKEVVEPLTKAGAQTSAGRMLKEVAGESYDDVLTALRTPSTPFATPSAAQATAGIRNPEIVALQKLSERVNPLPSSKRVDTQRLEREGLIGSFAGDDAQIKGMMDARKADFATNMGEASEASVRDRMVRESLAVPPRPVETLIPSNVQPGMRQKVLIAGEVKPAPTAPILEKLRENPLINAAVSDAKSLASANIGLPEGMKKLSQSQIDDIVGNVEKGIVGDPMRSLEGLQLVKFVIDNRLAPTMSGSATASVKMKDSAVSNIKSALLQGIRQTGKGGELFQEANRKFAEQSGEIFQKRVGQNMLGLLQKPLGEGETGAKLARAVEAETALVKKSGGFGRAGLDEQLTPENSAKVAKVISQLDVDTSLDELARQGAGSAKLQKVVGESIQLPNLMNQAAAITNGVIRRVFGAGQIKTLRELAEVMQDPSLTAKLMEKASTKEKNAVDFMRKTMQYYAPYAAAKAGEME